MTGAIAVAITVGISLAISGGLHLAGFFESQFHRPSHHDFGMSAELGLEVESVRFESGDGTSLRGWLLRPAVEPVGTVLYFQGSDRNISYTIRHVYWLSQDGFNVFLFDYRGYGDSAGRPERTGLVEDSIAAIDYVRGRPDIASNSLVLFGQSMGGQLALNAAAQRNDVGIRLIIAEATYARPSLHLSDKMARMGPLWLAQWAGWLFASDALSGEAAIARIESTPILLVHSDGDTAVAPYHSRILYQRAKGPITLWWLEGFEHLRVFDEDGNRQRLVAYIRKFLPESDGP